MSLLLLLLLISPPVRNPTGDQLGADALRDVAFVADSKFRPASQDGRCALSLCLPVERFHPSCNDCRCSPRRDEYLPRHSQDRAAPDGAPLKIDGKTARMSNAIASATPGLSAVEHAIIDVVAAWHRHRLMRGGSRPPLMYDRLDEATGAKALTMSTAIRSLVGRGVLAAQPGRGRRASEYLLDLPWRQTAMTVVNDVMPPWTFTSTLTNTTSSTERLRPSWQSNC
jgi:hypothetical protein